MKSTGKPAFLSARLVAVVAGVVGLAALLVWSMKRPGPASTAADSVEEDNLQTAEKSASDAQRDSQVSARTAQHPAGLKSAATHQPLTLNRQLSALPRPESSPLTRQLVDALSRLDQFNGPLTPEKVAEWKQNLQMLIQQGAAGVPAIRDYLEKNTDLDFGAAGESLGFASARRAMFDALQQIGGPEAVSAMTGALGTTADPKEIALLAKSLAQQDPELYRGQILEAVHSALAMAADKHLEGYDVGPLFQILQQYGGATAIADLEQATGQWKYYATMALAQLPDGAGIPSLIRMAQDGNGPARSRDVAMQMLAQVASQYPDARAALVEQVRSDKVPNWMWAYLTGPLAGDQFQVQDSVLNSSVDLARGTDLKTTHIASGNQNFISAPPAGGMTQTQIDQQMKLLDDLLAVASNPAAVQALQQAKATLAKRTPQTAAVAPGQ